MTRADDVKATRRVVLTEARELVVEIRRRFLTIRPIRTRVGGPSEIVISWGSVYLPALIEKVDRARGVKRDRFGRRIRKPRRKAAAK